MAHLPISSVHLSDRIGKADRGESFWRWHRHMWTPPFSKFLCVYVQCGRVQSYVRPMCAARMAAGPDDIRGLIPFTSTSLVL